jgi:hypothetical protein
VSRDREADYANITDIGTEISNAAGKEMAMPRCAAAASLGNALDVTGLGSQVYWTANAETQEVCSDGTQRKGMLMMRNGKRAGQVARFAIVLLTIVVAVMLSCKAQEPSEACDKVSIDSAGEYRIKHSKIEGIATTHNRGGIALYVRVRLGDRSEYREIEELSVDADLQPSPTIKCTMTRDSVRKVGFMTCTQSVKGFAGLRAHVKFRVNKAVDYESKMVEVLDYLIKDVLDCEPPGIRL